ncbi:MAG: transcription antitermination factor NusB [Alphaproteobacteria bacterium]
MSGSSKKGSSSPQGVLPKPVPVLKKTGSKKARLRAARLASVQLLYRMDVMNELEQLSPELIARAIADFRHSDYGQDDESPPLISPDMEWVERLLCRCELEKVHAVLHSIMKEDSSLQRLEPLLRAVLRVAIADMLWMQSEAPVIPDYLHITSAFYQDKEAGLINAILDQAQQYIANKE